MTKRFKELERSIERLNQRIDKRKQKGVRLRQDCQMKFDMMDVRLDDLTGRYQNFVDRLCKALYLIS